MVFRNGFPAELWPHGARIPNAGQGGTEGMVSAPRAAPAPGGSGGSGDVAVFKSFSKSSDVYILVTNFLTRFM